MSSVPSERRGAPAATVAIGSCPVCGNGAGELLLELAAVPVNCSALHRQRGRRRDRGADRHPCGSCCVPRAGTCATRTFDAACSPTTPRTRTRSTSHPASASYLADLAAELIDRHDLHGRTIVELGCGQGSFLGALCAGGENRGYGYDPSFRPGDLELPASVEIATELFVPAVVAGAGRSLLRTPRARAHPRSAAVPPGVCGPLSPNAARRSISRSPRERPCSAATRPSTSSIRTSRTSPRPRSSGCSAGPASSVDRVDHRFGGQYLSVEAHAVDGASRPSRPRRSPSSWPRREARPRCSSGDSSRRVPACRRGGVARAPDRALGSRGEGGSVPGAARPAGGRRGRHQSPQTRARTCPAAGVVVDAPEALAARRPEVVFVLNPMYREEISAMLAAQSIYAEVVVV